jgi:hypothetical protein
MGAAKMSNTAIVPLNYQAARMAARMVEALCRLGFEHRDLDGHVFRPVFSDLVLYGEYWLVAEVDAGRLWHFSVAELGSVKVAEQLSAVLRKPVKVMKRNGLYYVVELSPYQAEPAARLPKTCSLDLDARPAGELLVPIGEGRFGPVWHELAEMGHTLVVGETGSGKSVWLHSALAALLTGAGPDRLRVVLVDPKRSELTPWAGAPHVLGGVAHSEAESALALEGLADECDRRGELFGGIGARDLAGYNRRTGTSLPFIVCVVDEALDLTLNGGRDVLGWLKTLAMRGRSAGVFLWLATQHAAAVDGLPRVVNVNLSSRLVFRVLDGNAARSAGCPGAQDLPRGCRGRMLARLDDGVQEMQGYYLADEELERIAGGVTGGQGALRQAQGALTDAEVAMVSWALASGGGYLGLAEMHEVGGLGEMEAKRLAQKWERRGWLEKDRSRGNKRRVTPALVDLCQARVGLLSEVF